MVTPSSAVTFSFGAVTVETFAGEASVVSSVPLMVTVLPASVTGFWGVFTALFLAEEIKISPPVVRSSTTFWTAGAFTLPRVRSPEKFTAVRVLYGLPDTALLLPEAAMVRSPSPARVRVPL